MQTTLKDICDSYRRAWALRWRLVGLHIFMAMLVAALVSPLIGFFGQLAVELSGKPALTDFDILDFALSPVGAVGAMLAVSVVIVVILLELAAMILLEDAAREGRSLRFSLPFLGLIKRLPSLLVFAVLLTGRVLLMAAPFLGAAGLAAWLLLTGHDINYFLAARPPEFVVALVFFGLLLLALAMLLANRLAAWSLALPCLLLAGTAPALSFSESGRLSQGHRAALFIRLSIWAAAVLFFSSMALFAIWLISDMALSIIGDSLQSIFALLICMFILWSAVNAMISALAGGSLAALLNLQFERLGGASRRVDGRLRREASEGGHRLALALTAGFTAVAGVVSGPLLLDDIRTVDQVAVIAHRAGAAARPENTLAAARKAIEDGANWLEIDVQETADGEVVVLHDSDLMRVGGDPRKVSELTAAALAQIDVGGEPAPTLRQVLEAAKGRANVLIELKYYGHDKNLEARVAAIVDDTGMAGDIAVMSLNTGGVAALKALRPNWPAGLLIATALGDHGQLQADFLAVNNGLAGIDFIRRAGRPVYVWTVNDALSMSQAISRGAAGLITDDPALARQVLSDRAEMSSPERLLLQLADIFDLRTRQRLHRRASR